MPPVTLLTWLWQSLQEVATGTLLPVTVSMGFAGCQALSHRWEAADTGAGALERAWAPEG